MSVSLRTYAIQSSNTATTSGTITVPTVYAGEDLYVLAVSRDHTVGTNKYTCTDNDTEGNTWTEKVISSDRKSTLFWKKATSGTSAKTITISGTVGSVASGLSVFAGAASGDPTTNIVIEENISGNEAHATFTPDFDDSFVCLGITNDANDNAVTNGAAATLGALTSQWARLNTGGSDCAATIWGKAQVGTKTATGGFTWSQSNGTTYSVSWAIKPGVISLTTNACTNVTSTSATLNGVIDSLAGTNATDRGFCYFQGTTGDPTTADSIVYSSGDFGVGAFTESISSLSQDTGYRVRAIINVGGYYYGSTVQLTTASAQSSPTVALNSPADTSSTSETTPTLNFTGTDAQSDTLEYQIQVDTANTFASGGQGVNPEVLDSLNESYRDEFIPLYNGSYTGVGQSFTGTVSKLTAVKFFLFRSGSPTGSATAKLYAHTGTYGSSGYATGTALATSDILDVSTISGSGYELKTVAFSGANQVILEASTAYVIALEYSGGDASNCILCGIDYTDPAHSGNLCMSVGGYSAFAADLIFYVYTIPAAPLLDKVSMTDAGFTAGHPFASGAAKEYTVQSALTSPDTYYWRVRAIDPSGSNVYGSWSSVYSFDLTAGFSTKPLKIYLGSSWVVKPLKAYVGGAWVTKNLKIMP